MDQLSVLVVDDDRNIRTTLSISLDDLGYQVASCATGEEAIRHLKSHPTDILISDFRLEGLSGVELVKAAKEISPSVLSVVMTAFASYENAVQAIKQGAIDYLPKPFSMIQLEHLLEKLQRFVHLQRENERLRLGGIRNDFFDGYTSLALQRLDEIARKVAPTDATVLIVGESGTGKSEFARLLHARSMRADRPFIEVNCASLAETLLESELFGHVKGAFTGAVQDKTGKLEMAAGGTVFLDEVGELSMGGQAKLLHFLQERVVERIGGTKRAVVDARVFAATNRKLEEWVAQGRFREDLYYRLNVIECSMVALRHRPEDLPVLIRRILREVSLKSLLHEPPAVPDDVMRRLVGHDWPGNVRELRNVLERLVILSAGRPMTVDDLPASLQPTGPRGPASYAGPVSLKDVECEHIRRILVQERNLEKAAALLGITKVTLWRKRKEYGL